MSHYEAEAASDCIPTLIKAHAASGGEKSAIVKRGEYAQLYLRAKLLGYQLPAESVFDPTGRRYFAGGFRGYPSSHRRWMMGRDATGEFFGSVMARSSRRIGTARVQRNAR